MSRAFSAPGKALLAGGYLVLDPSYDAYVVALSSRMHAIIQLNQSESSTNISMVKISSPQFREGEWEYRIEPSCYKPIETNSRINPFIEATLLTILSYVQPAESFNLNITIYSDPGYHSQNNTTKRTCENHKKSFLFHNQRINDVPKTGLGSSAGLVSVLSAALLSHFEPGSEKSTDLLHNLVQVAHCLAQKKIGSGFDVAAAIYGSIIYRRFEPSVINKVLNDLETNPALFKDKVKQSWQFKHEKCALPASVRLIMGDIAGGSETPKMVTKILEWKKNNPAKGAEVYVKLNSANTRFMKAVMSANKQSLSESPLGQTEMEELQNSILDMRQGLRELSIEADVPVEPLEQTKLLDNVSSIDGCLGGLVPGAGGYDAVAVLALAQSVDKIKSITEETPNQYNNVHWVDLHEEREGLREEDPMDYQGL
ncbi:ERG8 [Candida oxycetoniae]|uniref:Phosphomevalonate kinase n=1 Tax=Candida oxycetoniae TaxID=497107 RepID=A0AAI9WWG7_9ASCO|nr:ERG8 [Candida oxycetoniae]KAI3402724.1 ERG8 [Candida oxycetoniae]